MKNLHSSVENSSKFEFSVFVFVSEFTSGAKPFSEKKIEQLYIILSAAFASILPLKVVSAWLP